MQLSEIHGKLRNVKTESLKIKYENTLMSNTFYDLSIGYSQPRKTGMFEVTVNFLKNKYIGVSLISYNDSCLS